MYRWFFFDIDGVLTDGRIWINDDGLGSKCMNMKDIDAINEMIRLGCRLVAITAEKNVFTNYVKNKFSWTYFKDGVSDKFGEFINIIKDNNVLNNEIVYIGDGKKDIPLFCGKWFTICPKDAILPIKSKADMILSGMAGSGALWEIVDWINQSTDELHADCITKTSEESLFKEELNSSLLDHISLIKAMDSDGSLKNDIILSGKIIVDSLVNKRKVLIFGNGGSAAET